MANVTELTVKVVSRIEEIPEKDWNSVFPAVLENYDFFKSLDNSSFEQFSFFYVLVCEENVPVGATACFSMDFPIDIAVRGPLKTLFNHIKKIFPKIFHSRVIMCGLPMGAGRIGVTKDSDRVINAIVDCLEGMAEEKKAQMIIFKDFTKNYKNMLRPLISRGFSKLESFPSTEMDINFKSFEEYLKNLSPKSREGLKRNLKKADKRAKILLEVKEQLGQNELNEVHGLYLQTYDKQDMGLEKLPLDFFRNVTGNMQGKTKFFLWSVDGKLVAFAFCLHSRDLFIDYYLGFDYSVAHDYYLYFVRFRDLLKWCIDNGIKKYEMGVTTYEPKKRLGFDFVRFYFYMKHRNKLLNHFFDYLSFFMKPVNFHPIFKQMKEDQ